MARYIDADALLKCKVQLYDENGVGLYAVGTGDILRMPTADVVEVVHGEWIDKGHYRYCSVCNYNNPHIYNYCPNCGADMRGGTDELHK